MGAFAFAFGPESSESEIQTQGTVSSALSNLTTTLLDLIEPIIVLVIIFGIMGMIMHGMRFKH